MQFNKWDIWRAKVRYEDSVDIKMRPVLIIDTKSMIVFALKIKSQSPRIKYSGEYSVIKWHEAGLNKQTLESEFLPVDNRWSTDRGNQKVYSKSG